MTKKIGETALKDIYSQGLYSEKSMDLDAIHFEKVLYTIFTATADVLNQAKSKEHPVAFVFDRIDESIVAAAIVQYFPNEDPEKPGNWNMVWTFDGADIPENARILTFENNNVPTSFKSIGGDKFGMKFKDTNCMKVTTTYALEKIYSWLDQNASETEEYVLEMDAVFQARVAVENGEKVFAIEPAGEIKMLIKDDAAIEK